MSDPVFNTVSYCHFCCEVSIHCKYCISSAIFFFNLEILLRKSVKALMSENWGLIDGEGWGDIKGNRCTIYTKSLNCDEVCVSSS